jgi:hypothetical protein
MSYKYRKEKRERAQMILKKLYEIAKTHFDDINDSYENIPYSDLADIFGREATTGTLFYSAAMMLFKNEHIRDKPDMAGYGIVRISTQGVDAYNSGFYHLENREDKLKETEYITKWIFPVISIILSVSAFVISIIILVHTWNKKQ